MQCNITAFVAIAEPHGLHSKNNRMGKLRYALVVIIPHLKFWVVSHSNLTNKRTNRENT